MPKAVNHVEYDGSTLIDLRNDTVTSAEHIMAGYYGHLANGNRVLGTGQGGPSATRHVIHFGFSDGTSSDIYVFYDDALISNAITASKPATHGGKLVTLAQLDGVTWYAPAAIPLNVQLVDYTTLVEQAYIGDDSLEHYNEWMVATDYIFVDPLMTFEYIGYVWYYVGFYDSDKEPLGTLYIQYDADTKDVESGKGTLTPAKFPAGTCYVRLSAVMGADDETLSLIRIA